MNDIDPFPSHVFFAVIYIQRFDFLELIEEIVAMRLYAFLERAIITAFLATFSATALIYEWSSDKFSPIRTVHWRVYSPHQN